LSGAERDMVGPLPPPEGDRGARLAADNRRFLAG